jgi:hypothetical protein
MRKESFHLDGKVPVESDKLKMCKRCDFNASAHQSLTKKGGTPAHIYIEARNCSLYIGHAKPNAAETTTIGSTRHILSF